MFGGMLRSPVRRRSRRIEKQSGFLSMKMISLSLAENCGVKSQLSSNNGPKKELRPPFASVVEVVSKILPPTLNLILSL